MTLEEIVSIILDLITSISVTIAALSFFFVIKAWKREYIGKSRI